MIEIQIPIVELENPSLRSLDSLYLIGEVKINETSSFYIQERGFIRVNSKQLTDTVAVIGDSIPGNENKFKVAFGGLGINQIYNIQAYIDITKDSLSQEKNRIYSNTIQIKTDNIIVSTRIGELEDNQVTIIGSVAGLKDSVTLKEYGHIWMMVQEPVDQPILSFEETSSEQFISIDSNLRKNEIFTNKAELTNNLRGGYFYAKSYVIYKDTVIYSSVSERYFGSFWEYNQSRINSPNTNSPGGLADGVSFLIEDCAFIGTGLKRFDNGAENVTNDFWKFNHLDSEWEKITPFGGVPRKNAVAFELNGKGYVGLGLDDIIQKQFKDFWEYTPSDNGGSWRQIADFPYVNRSAFSFVIDNRAFVGGGISCPDNVCSYKGDFYELVVEESKSNPDTTFTRWEKAPFELISEDRRINVVSLILDNTCYVIGGTKEIIPKKRSFDNIFSINLNRKEIIQLEASLESTFRQAAFGFVFEEDKLYFGGGGDGNINSYRRILTPFYEDFKIYDIKKQSFSFATEFPLGRISGAMYYSYDNKGYIYGGYINNEGNIQFFDDFVVFTP